MKENREVGEVEHDAVAFDLPPRKVWYRCLVKSFILNFQKYLKT